MFDQQKQASLAAWRKMAEQAEGDLDPEQQYDELLKAADQMEEQGLISAADHVGRREVLIDQTGNRI